MIENDVPNENKIVRTDKRFRNIIAVVYGAIFAGGIPFAVFALPPLLHKINRLHIQTSIFIGETVIIAFLLCFIFPALYLFSIGIKIKLHSRFPYPGMKVMRDTPVVTGKKAIAKARMLMYLGILAVVVSVAGSLHIHFIFQKIAHSELLSRLPLF